jgi:hypothetical protein
MGRSPQACTLSEKVLNSKDRYFLITKNPLDMKKILVDQGFKPGIDRVIVGPCNDRPGAVKLGNNQSITPEEAQAFEDITKLGLGGRPPRRGARGAGPVRHRLAATRAGELLARGLAADAHLARDRGDRLAGRDATHHRLPPHGSEPCVGMPGHGEDLLRLWT